MNDNFLFFWGLPILITKIDSNKYNKKNIIETIEKNYKISNKRNKWSTSFYQTDIHHSHSDESSNFSKVDYSSLQDSYNDCIQKYFKFLNLSKNFNYNYEIVNYTCSDRDSFMEPHIHSFCEFSMVHYCKFDKNEHNSTVFVSPYTFSEYWNNNQKIIQILNDRTDQSWLFAEWRPTVEEDDIIIYPSILKHFVRNKKSVKKRISIASNIHII